MQRLWAPWRMEYILGEQSTGCILCEKPKESCDEKNRILFRGQRCFVMMNLFPYNSGHLMIAPYRHSPSLIELCQEDLFELILVAQKTEAILKDFYKPDGFNMGFNIGKVAGAGIEEHVHLHIVPRWSGDTNFMPVLADIKVVPEHLERSYSQLRPYFSQLKLSS